MSATALVYNGADRHERPQPFGAEELERLGVRLLHPAELPLPRKLRDVARHRWHLDPARPGWWAATRADLVLAYLEPNLGYPALLRRVPGAPAHRTPLVAIVCWAAEDLRSGDDARRRRALRLLRSCDLVGFWSRNQVPILVEHGIAADRLVPLTFGIDLSGHPAPGTAPPDGERDIDVLAVGQDHGRDYATLAAAARGADWTVELVARAANLGGLALPDEVVVRAPVPHAAYRELLARARVVVVPTHDLAYPTGQTVALEAAASGCAVVVTGTAAMSDYFTDGVTALMPPAGDVAALRAVVDRLVEDPALRARLADAGARHVHARHRHTVMWHELAAELRRRGIVAAGAGR